LTGRAVVAVGATTLPSTRIVAMRPVDAGDVARTARSCAVWLGDGDTDVLPLVESSEGAECGAPEVDGGKRTGAPESEKQG